MKNILLLTPIYPADDIPSNATPVVHYFAKEWVKLGYIVKVVHYPSNFPFIMRWGAKILHYYLESKLNQPIRTNKLKHKEYIIDDVLVKRLPIFKNKPHGRYAKKQIQRAANNTIAWCESQNFIPDVIVGHWVNPQIEIMMALKRYYNVPTCLVMHDAGNDFRTIYKNEYKDMLAQIDILGYRSDAIKRKFESQYGVHSKWFYCYSGIPETFLKYDDIHRDFAKIRTFTFIGMLIPRKHPMAIIRSLELSILSNDYRITYIGQGKESTNILNFIKRKTDLKQRIKLTGRIPREEIKTYLSQTDIFIMISKNETFGLVYLEAMAAGCITIASRNEGFDGVIIDGYNGFLCEAGNEQELTSIINRLSLMSPSDMVAISENARKTAQNMSDKHVAQQYIDSIIKYI
ncbi:MAG: glycosyltransferase family 4 protein [Alistipes sp.]|nr:glycosyltransferase family 4 protein [Alistipes sp.]